jgi:hypothetical protein
MDGAWLQSALPNATLSERSLPLQIRSTSFVGTLLLAIICGNALADETTTAGQDSAAKGDEPAPGGCLPIGVTASGEIVFPLSCKNFLERKKGVAAQSVDEPKPTSETPAALPDQNSEAESKITTKPPEEKAPEMGQAEQNSLDTVASIQPTHLAKHVTERSRHLRHHLRINGSSGCTHYRTFDRNSKTYRDYSGHRRSCGSGD